MTLFVAFIDEVIDVIRDDVANHRPERGGALLGPLGQPVVTRFLYDPAATTSGSTYRPSRSLADRVRGLERAEPKLEFKGILHSHPGSFNQPSGGDRVAFADSLDGAPWLGSLIAPIVTMPTQNPGPHEIDLRTGLLSVFTAERDHGGTVIVRKASPHIIPLRQDLMALARELGGEPGAISLVDVNGLSQVAASVGFDGFAVQIITGPNYPFAAPTVLVVVEDMIGSAASAVLRSLVPNAGADKIVSLPLAWDLTIDDGQRLLVAVRQLQTGGTPSIDPQDLRRRLDGMVSDRLRHRRAMIVGAGSGGSQTADSLVRSGLEEISLIDHDKVEPANLSRSVYRAEHVGVAKVEALAQHLRSINPSVKIDISAGRLEDLDVAEIDGLVAGADLVVAATDDPHTQRLLGHFSYARGVPALFAGVFAKGVGGEIVLSVPGVTVCFACSNREKDERANHERRTDYGTGQLVAEPALGSDIQYIVTVSVKLAIGLLELTSTDKELPARDMMIAALSQGYSKVILSTIPEFDFFPKVFGDTLGQFAYQSVWVRVAPDSNCPVCGSNPVDPATVPISKAPRTSHLQSIAPSPHLEE